MWESRELGLEGWVKQVCRSCLLGCQQDFLSGAGSGRMWTTIRDMVDSA